MVKRRFRLSTVLPGLALLAAASGAFFVERAIDRPLNVPATGLDYEIRPGTPFAAVVNTLERLEVVDHPLVFRWYARLTGRADKVQAGEYHIQPGTSARGLLDDFVAGNVRLHSFTLVEGWNYRELLAALAANEALAHSMTEEDLAALLDDLDAPYTHPEGLFLPETYQFAKGTADRQILHQAYMLMQRTLTEEWEDRASGLPFTSAYEALILASIVEKETARPDERARIAGVFVRRLEKHMRLQTDPTVIYGIGADFDGNLTRADLRTDTPYNTYTRSGLPPTPIAMPGRASIHAALHPAPGEELYFVATGLGDGSHKFSVTKDEHDTAVRELLKRQRSNGRATRGQ